MSHYISTDIGDEEVILTGGSSHRTISAVSYSGFGIYGLYNAWDLNNGMSGAGEGRKVNFQVAEKAYLHAIAWALALKRSFPEKFKVEMNDIIEYHENFNDYIYNDIFDDSELEKLIEEKCEYHHELNEDQIKRSFYLLYGVLNFAYGVYEFTKKGNEVEIGFC